MATDLPNLDEIVIDKNKQPVSVNVDSNHFLGGNEGEINTIWAEKADYLNEDNLGEGLKNTAFIRYDENGHPVGGYNYETGDYEYDLTYKLSVAQATEDTIGGVKLGGPIGVDENGNLTLKIDSSTVATPTMPGFVAPSEESFNVDITGKLTLKPATDTTLGGIKVKKNIKDNYKSGLEMKNVSGSSAKDSLAVHTDFLIKQLGLSTSALRSLKNDGNSLDGAFEILLNLYELQERRYSTLHNLFKSYIEIQPTDGRPLIFGCDTFSKDGREITFGTEENPITNYSVIVKQLTTTLGDLGEIYVVKSKNRIIVYNTSENEWDMFCYLIVPTNVLYDPNFNPPKETIEYKTDDSGNLLFDENGIPLFEKVVSSTLPLKKGYGWFNGSDTQGPNSISLRQDGEDVSMFSDRNYSVLITPSYYGDGENERQITNNIATSIGEVWVEKQPDGFIVKCTGGKDESSKNMQIPFDWVAIPHNAKYDNIFFPLRCGTVVVDKEHTVFKQAVELPSEFVVDGKLEAVGVYPDGKLVHIEVDVTTKEITVLSNVADQEYTIRRDPKTMLPIIFLSALVKEYPIYNIGIEELCEIDFKENVFYDKKYHVLSQLSSDLGDERGSMGEYCCNIDSKTRSGFRIDNSGEAKKYSVDWVTIDNLPFPSIDTVAELNEKMVSLEHRLSQVNSQAIDQRLAQLETDARGIKEDIEQIKTDISEL